MRVWPKVTHTLSRLGDLRNEIDRWRGHELFHYPGTRKLLRLPPFAPQLVHAHNLHRDYFDLRFLPELSRRVPLVITLHDAWLTTGHCAHSFECERWEIGCGECPDLTIPPAIERDETAFNFQRKRALYAQSRFYVAAPCRWLLERAERSMLAPAMIESRVIPNGIDLEIFQPGDRAAARARLGLPPDADVLLFTALSIRGNVWKDYQTLRAAISRLTERPLIFLAVGEEAPSERIGKAEIRFVPFTTDSRRLTDFYQAADLYLHAARADTFPTSVLEALACGTPVVATAVGGIPEQIRDGATGLLTPAGDAQAMAEAINALLDDPARRETMGHAAAADARARFDRRRMVADYLEWFAQITHGMKISIVTPSFNQASYLEATLRSLLDQNYPDLELIVIDGGSTDGSVEIIRRYAAQLSHWESERDRGQSHALNKGFAHVHGDIWTWLNSDDLLEPGVLQRVAQLFAENPEVGVVYGDCVYVAADGETVVEKFRSEPHSRLRHLAHRFIAQPSCFFRTSMVPPGVREDLHYCMDYDLWLKLAARGVPFLYVPELFSRYRLHEESKSVHALVAMHEEIRREIYRPILRSGASREERQAIASAAGDMIHQLNSLGARGAVLRTLFFHAWEAGVAPSFTLLGLGVQAVVGPRLVRLVQWLKGR